MYPSNSEKQFTCRQEVTVVAIFNRACSYLEANQVQFRVFYIVMCVRVSGSHCLLWLFCVCLCPSCSLTLSPLLVHSDVVQCGCNNSALSLLSPTPEGETPIQLTLTAFFSFNRPQDSECSALRSPSTSAHLLPAVLIALDQINNSSDILNGYHLTVDIRDSQCDPLHAVTEYVDSVTVGPSAYSLGVLASDCGCVADTLGGLVSHSLQVPVISYGLGSGSQLVTRSSVELSSLFRVARSTLQAAQSASGFMRHFSWTDHIAFVTVDDGDTLLSTVKSVMITDSNSDTVLLDGGNGTITLEEFAKLRVSSNGLVNSSSVVDFYERVRAMFLRVILGLVPQRVAAQLICTGRMGTLPGDGFVYVFIGPFTDNWWQTETESCNLTSADVQSVIVLSANSLNPDPSAMLQSGSSVHDFKSEYRLRLREWCGAPAHEENTIDYTAAGLVYDSVWSLALALNRSIGHIDRALQGGKRQNTTLAILRSLESVSFSGVTGQVQFSNRARIEAGTVHQVQNGVQVLVGWYSDGAFKPNPHQKLVWNGSCDLVPSSAPEVIVPATNYGVHWLVLSMVLAISGIVLAFSMCVFNWRYSKHKILVASSQKLNYIIISGAILGYLDVIIVTLSSPFLDGPRGAVFCYFARYFFVIYFTLIYGTLFARAWRIYRIFHNPWSRKRPLKDGHLIMMVLVAVCLDLVIPVSASIIDPYEILFVITGRDYVSFTVSNSYLCSRRHQTTWTLIFFFYKLCFISCGVYIISLVRNEVSVRKIYDDSRLLAAAITITAVSYAVGAIIWHLLSDVYFDLYFVGVGISVNVSASGTLICVFIPKFYKIIVKKDSGDSYRKARTLYYGAPES